MKIGSLFGVDIFVSKFFILVLLAVALLNLWDKVVMIYIIICVHELAHLLAAKILHVRIKRLEFLPFGCSAKIEETLELRPLYEAAIALSGPLSNILMALVAVFIKYYIAFDVDIVRFVQINLLLGGFNLLPALPMDGGRTLRALLSRRMGIKRALSVTLIITAIISAGALAGGVYLLIQGIINPNLFMIAGLLLVYTLRGRRETSYLKMRSFTHGGDVMKRSGVMGVRQIAVREDTTLGRLMDMLIAGRYHIVTVVNKQFGKCGQLDEGDIMDAYIKYGSAVEIKKVMEGR
ncbi:site-2 protease family protein [Clostridia bacterium OttesenSCG-928-F22]|nr:site-2 protease family protein [Clostridia bacterium OttesenSCG-928-F22]